MHLRYSVDYIAACGVKIVLFHIMKHDSILALEIQS
jgi:hypothetical protein